MNNDTLSLNISNISSNITITSENLPVEEGSFLSIRTLVAVLILIIYTIATPIFEKLNFHYIHESGICMILGCLVGLISMLTNPSDTFKSSLQFDDEVFFNFILPPIIFAAGYNLKKKSFFRYFFYIFIFGILGTILTFSIVAPLTYVANSWSLFGLTFQSHTLNFSIREILLFSSVIVSTDTVAALTFVKEANEPKLFSILFGEGVLNDAVCIVLYRIIKSFKSQNEEFNSYTLLSMFASFSLLFVASTLLGIFGGLACAYFLKQMRIFRLNRVQEISLVIFFAFITYSVTDLIGFSPIIALLFCGIFMSHYAFYNISFQAREETSIVTKLMSNIAEGFVFAYLGLTSVSTISASFSFSFIILILLFVLIGRWASIYGLSFLLKLVKCPNFNMKESDKGIMSFAGSIRGAIAFGLCISIESNISTNKEVMTSSTMVIVFFTTVFFGALMPRMVKYFKQNEKSELDIDVKNIADKNINNASFPTNEAEDHLEKYSISNYDVREEVKVTKRTEELNMSGKISKKITGLWRRFDNFVMKPFFIGDWPYVKEDHDQLSEKIISVFDEHQKRKIKNKELANLIASDPKKQEKIESLLLDRADRTNKVTKINTKLNFK